MNIQSVLYQFIHAFLRSKKTTRLYFIGDLTTDKELFQFDYSTKYFELLGCIDKVVEFTSKNGGFAVTGLCKIVTINGRVLIYPNYAGGGRAASGNHNQDNQVTVSDVNYRITELLP